MHGWLYGKNDRQVRAQVDKLYMYAVKEYEKRKDR